MICLLIVQHMYWPKETTNNQQFKVDTTFTTKQYLNLIFSKYNNQNFTDKRKVNGSSQQKTKYLNANAS